MERKRGKRNDSPATASSAPPPPWTELPRELTVNILRRLGPKEVLDTAERVCTTWLSVCREPSFWQVIDMIFDYTNFTYERAGRLYRRVVDRRSQGGLIDITIRFFGSDDLLRYISERSGHLKILRIKSGFCSWISGKGLTAAVKNFPHLEELHLFFMPPLNALDIEEIGVSCPMLNSFTLYNCYSRIVHTSRIEVPDSSVDEDDHRAVSIGKCMPNLRRLCLFSNGLSNKGLLAILDGCTNLEFLDLRGCSRVDLQSDVGRRCSEQIKVLRRY